MEVNKSYIEFLLQLLNNDENIDIENHQEELIVNLQISSKLANVSSNTIASVKLGEFCKIYTIPYP